MRLTNNAALGKVLITVGTHPVAMIILTTFAAIYDLSTDTDALINIAVISIVPMVVAYVVVTSREERARQFKRIFKWAPPLVGVLSVPYFTFTTNHYGIAPETEFYATAAQVVPVFMLALMVDVGRSNFFHGADLGWTILACIAGEGSALGGCAFEENRSSASFIVIAASIVTLFVALLLALGAELNVERTPEASQ